MKKAKRKSWKRGLAFASQKTRKRVATAGGKAPHVLRGLQAASKATRAKVSRMGGKARSFLYA